MEKEKEEKKKKEKKKKKRRRRRREVGLITVTAAFWDVTTWNLVATNMCIRGPR